MPRDADDDTPPPARRRSRYDDDQPRLAGGTFPGWAWALVIGGVMLAVLLVGGWIAARALVFLGSRPVAPPAETSPV